MTITQFIYDTYIGKMIDMYVEDYMFDSGNYIGTCYKSQEERKEYDWRDIDPKDHYYKGKGIIKTRVRKVTDKIVSLQLAKGGRSWVLLTLNGYELPLYVNNEYKVYTESTQYHELQNSQTTG